MNGNVLNHRVSGSGSPVLLLHPIGLDLECWDAVLEHIGSGYRILRVDLPGHGSSPPSPADATLSDYARAVHETLRELGAAPTAVVGLSFGGMVAQTLALDFPEDVSCLVLAGCPSTLPDAARTALRERGTAARSGMEAVIPATLERWFTRDFIAAGGAERVRERLQRDEVAEWIAAWAAISRIDTRDRLQDIRVPALCVAGELDAAAAPAVLADIASHLAQSRLVVLPGVPHMMQIERPELFGEAIRAFLDEQRRA